MLMSLLVAIGIAWLCACLATPYFFLRFLFSPCYHARSRVANGYARAPRAYHQRRLPLALSRTRLPRRDVVYDTPRRASRPDAPLAAFSAVIFFTPEMHGSACALRHVDAAIFA